MLTTVKVTMNLCPRKVDTDKNRNINNRGIQQQDKVLFSSIQKKNEMLQQITIYNGSIFKITVF
jgi:hypothetical protein